MRLKSQQISFKFLFKRFIYIAFIYIILYNAFKI